MKNQKKTRFIIFIVALSILLSTGFVWYSIKRESKQLKVSVLGIDVSISARVRHPTSIPSPISTPISTPTQPQPSPFEEELPSQLFDISLELDNTTVSDIANLVARVIFESFGTEPTPVDLTFRILDEQAKEVHREKDSIVVETEAVFTKKFEGLTFPKGKYTLVLKTLYNVDVEDEFRADFEIVEEKVALLKVLISAILTIGAVIVSWLLLPKTQQGLKMKKALRRFLKKKKN